MLQPEVQWRSANKLSQQTPSYQCDQTRMAREGETRRQDGRSRPKSSSPGRGEGSQDIDLITPTHDSSKGITT